MAPSRSMMLAVASLVVAGCGLFDNADKVTVSSEWLDFGVDADAFGIRVPGEALPQVDCSANADVCTSLGDLSCGGAQYGCHIDCGTDGNCQVTGVAEDGIPVDLSSKASPNQLGKIKLQSIEVEVTANSLNFATPRIDLRVGPTSAEDALSAAVAPLGVIEPIAAGTTSPPKEVPLDAAGVEAMTRLARDSGGKFKIFARGTTTFAGGQQLPAGALDFRVRALFQIDVL